MAKHDAHAMPFCFGVVPVAVCAQHEAISLALNVSEKARDHMPPGASEPGPQRGVQRSGRLTALEQVRQLAEEFDLKCARQEAPSCWQPSKAAINTEQREPALAALSDSLLGLGTVAARWFTCHLSHSAANGLFSSLELT